MSNRVTAAIERMEKQIKDRIARGITTQEKVDNETGPALDMNFDEHFLFQEIKSLAFVSGLLNSEEAQTLYALLGNSVGVFNRQSVATKAVLTEFLKQLLELRKEGKL